MGHILIVDDHNFLLKALSILLGKEGYTFETANNGEEAITIFESGSFDAVITDLDMPIKSGFDLLRHIKIDLKSEVPVIVLSSLFTTDNVSEMVFELGASHYVSKTESPLGIVGALRSVTLQAS